MTTPEKSDIKPVFTDNLPNKIWYADKPINEGGKEREISIAEFIEIYQAKMGVSFEYTETFWVDANFNPEQVDNTIDQQMVEEIKQLLQQPLVDKFVVCYLNSTIGFVAYARCEIPELSIVAAYTGEIATKRNVEQSRDNYLLVVKPNEIYNLDQTYQVSPKNRGGLSRFFCHLPEDKIVYDKTGQNLDQQLRALRLYTNTVWKYDDGFVQQVETTFTIKEDAATILQRLEQLRIQQRRKQIDTKYKKIKSYYEPQFTTIPGLQNYIETDVKTMFDQSLSTDLHWHVELIKGISDKQYLTANISYSFVMIDGYPVPFFYARRTIQRGEMLGFDYRSAYWFSRERMPDIFDKKSKLIPRKNYYYDRAFIYHPIDKKGFYIHRKQYYENIDEQMPVQIGPFKKPFSFFQLRNILVNCNVIPIEHAKLENDQFSERLQQVLSQVSDVRISCYRHNPESKNKHEQQQLDVVCYFSNFLHWANMTDVLKSNPVLSLNNATYKCFQITQEIIFRIASKDKTTPQQIIACLSELDLQQILNAPNLQKNRGDVYYKLKGKYVSTPKSKFWGG